VIFDTPTPNNEPQCGDPDENDSIPLYLVIIVLAFWMLLCCAVFVYFENWTLFDTLYFFFISLTTIGFGDVTSSHRVAVANFLLILIGLSVVTMAINVVQMQLEILFGKFVQSIDDDFKMNLLTSSDEKKAAADLGKPDIERGLSSLEARKESSGSLFPGDDVVKQYGGTMRGSDRLLMQFLSHHQRKMLNEKFEERARMRNKWTQTLCQKKVASVQVGGSYPIPHLPIEPEEDTPGHSKSRITTKRLYIYNTGE
ncbi:Ion channel, partial [Ostertagia ostertagi]